jgi:hypothetical protein
MIPMFSNPPISDAIETRALGGRRTRPSSVYRAHVRLSVLPLLALALAGCSDEATVVGEQPGTPSEAAGPLYLVATTFSAGDQDQTYFVTSPSFDPQTQIDSTNGPQLLGGVVPTVYGGAVFAPDSAGPVITRYDVGAGDQLQVGAQLSFAGVGMTEILSWHIYIVRDKGYVFDPAGSRLILWDPRTMTLTGEQLDLPMIVREGWVPNLVFEHSGPVLRGDTLLVPLSWTDQDGNSRHASGVLALDIETDQVLGVDEDERCGESYATITAPSGDVYFFPPDWSAAPHFFADMFSPTCVLRVLPGATAFDDTDALDLSALGSGLAAAGAVPDGGSGFFFTTVDEALWDDGNGEGGAVWKTWHYDFTTQVSRPVGSLPDWSGQLYYVNVGGAYFIPYWRETDAGDQTTLYSVGTGDTDPTPSFSFEGNWYGLAQLR